MPTRDERKRVAAPVLRRTIVVRVNITLGAIQEDPKQAAQVIANLLEVSAISVRIIYHDAQWPQLAEWRDQAAPMGLEYREYHLTDLGKQVMNENMLVAGGLEECQELTNRRYSRVVTVGRYSANMADGHARTWDEIEAWFPHPGDHLSDNLGGI